MPAIPRHPSDLTPAWFTAALDHAGHTTSVAEVAVSPVGTGQMADCFRAKLTYRKARTGAPSSLVVKMTSADESSRSVGATGAYLREVEWYRQLQPATAIATPRMFFADIDIDTSEFVLVLQDMAPAQQGDQIGGCSVAQAQNALRALVGLHAPTWRDESLRELAWLYPTADIAARLAFSEQLFATSSDGFLARYVDRLDRDQQELLQQFSNRFDRWIRKDHGVFAVTHGDYRLDNLLFEPAPSQIAWTVDWQTLRLDNPLTDVAYFLGTGLDSDDRSRYEHELVLGYHDRLLAHGVTGYTFNECFADYRAQSLYSLVIIVLGAMLTKQTARGDEMFMAMLKRATRQISDLNAIETLV